MLSAPSMVRFANIFFFLVVLWTIFGGVFLNNLFLQIFISCSNSVSFRIRIPSIFFFNTLTENSISSIVILLSSNRRLEQKRGKVRLNATIQTHVAKKVCYFYCKYFTLLSKNYSHQLHTALIGSKFFHNYAFSKHVFL